MKITIQPGSPLTPLRELKPGECFIAAQPKSDHVYMITSRSWDNGSYVSVVSLKDGHHYPFSADFHVRRVMCEMFAEEVV